jgi:hypothetical protein
MVLFSPNLFIKRFGEKEGFPPPEVVGSSWQKQTKNPKKEGTLHHVSPTTTQFPVSLSVKFYPEGVCNHI